MITFTLALHGPFHVSTGTPDEGMDSPIDLTCPLPSTSLKGLLRAEATERLDIPQPVIDEIFGRSAWTASNDPQRSTPGAWSWTDALFEEVTPTTFARIRIDDAGRTVPGFLGFGMHAWARGGTFTVEPRIRLSDTVRERHTLVLRAAARSVSSLGGDRRRGSGWVTMTDPLPWTAADTANLLALRGTA